jgi:hypothetical protein
MSDTTDFETDTNSTPTAAPDMAEPQPVTSNPIDSPGAWDYVVLGGCISPGRAEVDGCDRKHKWKDPEGKGVNGGMPKYEKEEKAKPIVKLTLWEQAQFGTLENFIACAQASLRSNPKKALSFEYPEAQRHGINSVVVEGIGTVKGDASKGWEITFWLGEAREAKVVQGSGVGAGAAGAAADAQAFADAAAEKAKDIAEQAADMVDDMYDAIVGEDDTGHTTGDGGPGWIP